MYLYEIPKEIYSLHEPEVQCTGKKIRKLAGDRGYRGQTNEIQGIVFTKNGYHFNGSKVDRRFSYSKIDAALQRNRYGERMNLIPKVCTTGTPNATSDAARGELVSGSLELLNGHGSSCNATDAEANLEMAEILRRKKKRKRGIRL